MVYHCQAVTPLSGWNEIRGANFRWEFGIPDESRLAEIHGLITVPQFPLTRERLQRLSHLMVLSAYGTGYDYIDVAAASELGILVTHTPDAVVNATAELGLTLILALMRQIIPHDVATRESRVGLPEVPLAHDAHDRVVGLVGYGKVGRRLAELLRAIGFTVRYTRQHGPFDDHAGYSSLSDILMTSDFVVVLTPLTTLTRHLIGTTELRMMKSTAFLINIGRGPCVDEEAFIEALQSHEIAGAALDVFEHEPRVTEAILAIPTVILSPHVGTRTWETRAKMTAESVLNIEDGLRGIARNALNAQHWTRRPFE